MNSAWLDRSLISSPFHIALCLTRKQFERKLKECSIPKEDWMPFVTVSESARVHRYSHEGTGYVFVCIDGYEQHAEVEIYGLLVHEAMHIWRWIREYIDEETPSSEFEAYAMQNLSQRLIHEFKRQTKKRKK